MPLCRVIIEEIGDMAIPERRWMCEMEAGVLGMFKTHHMQGPDIEDILRQVMDVYRVATGVKAKPAEPDEDVVALRKDAEDLGVVVDGRWGAGRLRREIDAALAANVAAKQQAAVAPVTPAAPAAAPAVSPPAPSIPRPAPAVAPPAPSIPRPVPPKES